MTDHDLGIDEVLGAAERDETDFDHADVGGSDPRRDRRGNRESRVKPTGKQKRRSKTAAGETGRRGASLLLLCGGFNAFFLALEVGSAAFALDVLVQLLAHGV